MNIRIFSVIFAVLTLPLAGRAAEEIFFSKGGKYALSSATTLTVSQDMKGHQDLTLMLHFASDDINKTLVIDHPGERFLIYWDVANQTLWCGTARTIGYLNVRTPQFAASDKRARVAAPQDGSYFPSVPATFFAELERAIPARP